MRAGAPSAALGACPTPGCRSSCEGRFVYLAQPRVLRRLRRARVRGRGARLIGGCCGTTPAHIRAMRERARARTRAAEPLPGAEVRRHRSARAGAECTPAAGPRPSCCGKLRRELRGQRRDRSAARHQHAQGDARARALMAHAAWTAINIAGLPDGAHPDERAGAAPTMIHVAVPRIEIILHFTTPRPQPHGAAERPARRARAGHAQHPGLTGDPPSVGDYPNATAVFDMDSIGLMRIIQRMNAGHRPGRHLHRRAPRSSRSRCAVNPDGRRSGRGVRALPRKLDAGAAVRR